jgi:hypothetical protein
MIDQIGRKKEREREGYEKKRIEDKQVELTDESIRKMNVALTLYNRYMESEEMMRDICTTRNDDMKSMFALKMKMKMKMKCKSK